MNIKLTWTDVNGYGGFKIYRGTAPLDIEDLPSPIAVLSNTGAPAPSTVTWVDGDVEMNETYFYIVSSFYGAQEKFTPNLSVTVHYTSADIGSNFQGGQYIGNIVVGDDTYAIIASLKAGESGYRLQWKTEATATAGTDSLVDGWANTQAMITAGIAAHPAANYCVNYSGGGFDDWYLPARDELNLMWTNRANLSLSMRSDAYWTSSQSSATIAHRQDFSNGSQGTNSKNVTYYVRPVRRLKLII